MITVPLFEMDRAKTSRAPFQVLRGAIDAPRVGAFDKPAGGVVRGLSRLPPPKKCRASEAILPSSDVADSPARPAGSRGRLPLVLPLVLGRFCLFWSALSSSRPHTNPATEFYRSPPPHPFSRSHARDFWCRRRWPSIFPTTGNGRRRRIVRRRKRIFCFYFSRRGMILAQ